jgi:hypothetical protein
VVISEPGYLQHISTLSETVSDEPRHLCCGARLPETRVWQFLQPL